MNTTLRSALCCLLVLALGACAEETGPETTVVNAKVDGVPFTSQAVTNVHATSSLRFTAVQAATSDTIIIDMPKIQGTGSLVIGGKGGVVAEYRAPGKYFTSIDTINTVQGSVDVSQFDDKGAVGTFTFQIYQNKDFNGDIAVVNEGSFSIKFSWVSSAMVSVLKSPSQNAAQTALPLPQQRRAPGGSAAPAPNHSRNRWPVYEPELRG